MMMPDASIAAPASVNAPATPAGGNPVGVGVAVGAGAGVAVGGNGVGTDIAERVGVALGCGAGGTVGTGNADGLVAGDALGAGDAVGTGYVVGAGEAGFRVGVAVGEVKLAGVSAANIRFRQTVRAMPS
jgi:hypothetical protein